MPYDEALTLLLESRGVHFDARIVDAFLNYYNRVNHIDQRYPLASSA